MESAGDVGGTQPGEKPEATSKAEARGQAEAQQPAQAAEAPAAGGAGWQAGTAPPPDAAPPADSELRQRIEKLAEFTAKNGSDFEALMREKQKDNPGYAFLSGGLGADYYRRQLFLACAKAAALAAATAAGGAAAAGSAGAASDPVDDRSAAGGAASESSAEAGSFGAAGLPVQGAYPAPQQQPMAYPPQLQPQYPHMAYAHPMHQHTQHYLAQPQMSAYPGQYPPQAYGQEAMYGASAGYGLPGEVAVELGQVLDSLNGTKDAIKGAKTWFMQHAPLYAYPLAIALRDRVRQLFQDSERQLHVVYLVNDILFHW